jgi:hypothetical protein
VSEPALDVQGTFLAVVEALDESGVPYAFIGDLPVLAWGRVRATTGHALISYASLIGSTISLHTRS